MGSSFSNYFIPADAVEVPAGQGGNGNGVAVPSAAVSTAAAVPDASQADVLAALQQILQVLQAGLKVSQPVWIEPGPNCISFAPAAYLDISGVGVGTTATLIMFAVPDGFNGVIYDLANTCDSPQFVDGSGELVWAIQIDTNYAQNFNAMTSQRGTVDAPVHLSCPIFVKEGQIISLVVTNVSLAVGPGPVIGGLLGGWFYPASEEPADSWA